MLKKISTYVDEEGYGIATIEMDEYDYIKIFRPEEIENAKLEMFDTKTLDFSINHHLFKRDECVEKEAKIAKYLFRALWDSDNGCTTYIEASDVCEACDVEESELRDILEHFGNADNEVNFFEEGVLEWEEEEIGIFYDFLEYFDTNGFEMFKIM